MFYKIEIVHNYLKGQVHSHLAVYFSSLLTQITAVSNYFRNTRLPCTIIIIWDFGINKALVCQTLIQTNNELHAYLFDNRSITSWNTVKSMAAAISLRGGKGQNISIQYGSQGRPFTFGLTADVVQSNIMLISVVRTDRPSRWRRVTVVTRTRWWIIQSRFECTLADMHYVPVFSWGWFTWGPNDQAVSLIRPPMYVNKYRMVAAP